MIPSRSHSLDIARRTWAFLYSALFVASLVSAPLVHEWTCDGACARASLSASSSTDRAAVPPCHAAAAPGSKRHGCQCTDACCSLWAQYVSPPALEVGGEPSLLASAPVAYPPQSAPRARLPHILPYPTGPPATT